MIGVAFRQLALRGAIVLIGSLLVAGCPLPPPILDEFPSADPIIECSVTVRNPDAVSESGVESLPDSTITNRSAPFLIDDESSEEDGAPLRHYYLSTEDEGHCLAIEAGGSLWGFATLGEAEDDWSRFARQHIQSLAGQPPESSVFAMFPGNWCAVAGTLQCRATDEPIEVCQRRSPIDTAPLPECPPPPQPPDIAGCLAIDCNGDEDCTGIDFGDVPLGETPSRIVSLTNECSQPDAIVSVSVSGIVDPVGALSDFSVPVDPAQNTCLPPDPDIGFRELSPGTACAFAVEFAPAAAGEHRAETIFSSNALPEPQAIALRGNGIAGELEFTVPDLPDPAQIPPRLCVDELVNGCTATRALVVTNSGPGAVTVTAQFVQNQGFELVNPPVFPTDLAAAESESLLFRWCGDAATREEASLVVDSNDPAQPSFIQDTIREPGGCEPDPTLVAAYGFEGTGPTILDVTGNGHDGALVDPATRNPNGRLGSAVEFTGLGGHVDLGAGLDIAGDQLTIAFWMRADDFEVNEAVFVSKAEGLALADRYWAVGTAGQQGQRFRFRLKTAGITDNRGVDGMLQAGVWTHIAVTYDGVVMANYKDGVQLVTGPKTGDIDTDPAVIVWIGDNPPAGGESFDGLIDEVRIYARALDAQEIQQIMSTPLPLAP